jgi:hypothetical protein
MILKKLPEKRQIECPYYLAFDPYASPTKEPPVAGRLFLDSKSVVGFLELLFE